MATRTRKTTPIEEFVGEAASQEPKKEAPKKTVEPKKAEAEKPSVEELKANPRFATKAAFHEMVTHQNVSEATIYNRLRGIGKSGKPTRKKLEGLQASDGSWWVDLEGEEAKELLNAEKRYMESMINQGVDETVHIRRGMSPAELRAKLNQAIREMVEMEREIKSLKSELEKATAENESLNEEVETLKATNRASNQALKETDRQLNETRQKLSVSEGKLEAIFEFSRVKTGINA